MISYKDFIELMEIRGYTFKNNNPIMIDEYNPTIKTFYINTGSTGKILELTCPDNIIISACGKNHPGDWQRNYYINIECFDEKGKEPYQEFHQCIVLTATQHVIADIIITKILQKEINRNDPNIKQSLIFTDPILKFIGSENPNEYPMWTGNYKTLHKEFLNDSFNLYSGEKIIFYATKPDIDIKRVKFEMRVDMFEIKKSEVLIILDKENITDMTSLNYKHTANM